VPHRGLCAPGFRLLCRAVFGVGGRAGSLSCVVVRPPPPFFFHPLRGPARSTLGDDVVAQPLSKSKKRKLRMEATRQRKEAEAAAAADVGGDDDDEQQRVVHREVEHESLLDRLLNEDVELEELDEEEAEPAAGASDFVEEQENVEQEQSEEGGRELE